MNEIPRRGRDGKGAQQCEAPERSAALDMPGPEERGGHQKKTAELLNFRMMNYSADQIFSQYVSLKTMPRLRTLRSEAA